jgi:hypothetical protein
MGVHVDTLYIQYITEPDQNNYQGAECFHSSLHIPDQKDGGWVTNSKVKTSSFGKIILEQTEVAILLTRPYIPVIPKT